MPNTLTPATMKTSVMDDEAKKAMDFVQQQLSGALQSHIGAPITKDNIAAVKNTVEKMLASFAKDRKIVEDIEVDVIGDAIKFKLKQPSFINEILPRLEAPFVPWLDGDGVVHVTGRVNGGVVRICDWAAIQPGTLGSLDEAVTCLTCLTLNRLP